MRFSSYFETDFLSNEKISLIKVLCSEQKKSFHLELKGEKLLSIDSLKKLVTGIKKLQEERVMRKYDVTYSISYDDLRSDDEKLYLEYYRVLLTEICVDYELFPNWEKFSTAAKLAIDAATLSRNPMEPSKFWHSSTALPLDNTPYYLIEHIDEHKVAFIENNEERLRLWINALCPDEHTFERIKDEAVTKFNEFKEEFKNNSLLAAIHLNNSSIKKTQFCSLELQRSEGQKAIGNILKDWGIE